MNDIRRFDSQIEAMAASMLRMQYVDEIELAIRNAKRTAWDKWFRKQFYRAAAQRERRFDRRAPTQPSEGGVFNGHRSPRHRPVLSGACGHGGGKDEHL